MREEQEHLLNADDYFDWYAHNGLPKDPGLVSLATQEGIIYSYDLAATSPGYRIVAKESTFVLAGASFVRHADELSCLLVAGEQPPDPPDNEVAKAIASQIVSRGKEEVVPDPTLTIKDRYLESHPDFARVIILTRLDLISKKHDVRYVALDMGASYCITTDDPAIWEGIHEHERPDRYSPDFTRHDELFSALASMIYLPLAFADMQERVEQGEFASELGSRMSEKPFAEAIAMIGPERAQRNAQSDTLRRTQS